MNDFIDILNYFKKGTSPDKVLSVMENEEMCHLMLAWKNIGIKYLPNQPCPEQEDFKRWDWLWTRIEFDKELLQTVSGLRVQNFENFFIRAKTLKLIYPDGSIDTYVAQYFNSVIIKKIGNKK